MKLLITGDWHLDEKKPKNRSETYIQDQKDKVKWILDTAKMLDIKYILQPGDLCNTSKLSDGFKTWWIQFISKYYPDILILTIPGQHDMRYHSSNIANTPIGVLNASGIVNVIDDKPWVAQMYVDIYGAGWEQEIPEIEDPKCLNILLLHKLITPSPLWPGHKDYVTPKWLLDNTKFDLIVTGDNHNSFAKMEEKKHEGITIDRRYVINCGSLMRSSIDQKDHEPVVWVYDTETKDAEPYLIPVKPFNEVMQIEEAEKEKELNKELETFVEGLSETNIEGLDFKKNLIDYIKENNVEQDVADIINEVLTE